MGYLKFHTQTYALHTIVLVEKFGCAMFENNFKRHCNGLNRNQIRIWAE